MFVTFEGVDGAGKTAQVARLARSLDLMGHEVMVTREPGGTPYGETVRQWLIDHPSEIGGLAQAFLFNSARAQLMETVVVPALRRGTVVLCDRFFDSTIVYQGLVPNNAVEPFRSLCEHAVAGIRPNITVYLAVDYQEAARRVAHRDNDDDQDLEFFKKVNKAYDRLIQSEPNRFLWVNGMGEPHEVADKIIQGIRQKVPNFLEKRDGNTS